MNEKTINVVSPNGWHIIRKVMLGFSGARIGVVENARRVSAVNLGCCLPLRLARHIIAGIECSVPVIGESAPTTSVL